MLAPQPIRPQEELASDLVRDPLAVGLSFGEDVPDHDQQPARDGHDGDLRVQVLA